MAQNTEQDEIRHKLVGEYHDACHKFKMYLPKFNKLHDSLNEAEFCTRKEAEELEASLKAYKGILDDVAVQVLFYDRKHYNKSAKEGEA
jgi:hypothetical protein